jgi:hypothetical protein
MYRVTHADAGMSSATGYFLVGIYPHRSLLFILTVLYSAKCAKKGVPCLGYRMFIKYILTVIQHGVADKA